MKTTKGARSHWAKWGSVKARCAAMKPGESVLVPSRRAGETMQGIFMQLRRRASCVQTIHRNRAAPYRVTALG